MAVSLRTVLTVAAMATLVSVRAQLTPLNLAGSMNMPPPMNMPQSMNSNPSMPMPMNMPLPETNLKPFRLPEPPKLEGALAPNSALSKAQKLYLPGLKGPESLVLVNSYIYTGVSASQVIELIPTPRGAYMKYRDWQLSPNRMCYTTATVSKTRDEMGCGRPLGLRMHKKSLIGMDASKGIFQISFSRAFPNGTVRWLMPSTVNVNGRNVQFRFLNDLAVSKDDLIYFTTSSDKHSRASFMKIILEGDDSGKVWMFNMRTRQVQPVLHTLHFPNGIQLAEDDSFLLVAEGARARIHRVWLKGPRRGQKETFADNLPGFVDNLRTSPRGTYWVALSSVRSRDAPGVLDRYGPLPKIRQQILMMPEEDVLARAPKYGMVVELNAQGQVIRSLHDPTGKVYGPVSEVQEYNGVLFLGSYTANFIGVLTKLPPIVQPPPPPAPTTARPQPPQVTSPPLTTNPQVNFLNRVRSTIANFDKKRLQEVVMIMVARYLEARVDATRAVERANRIQTKLNEVTKVTPPAGALPSSRNMTAEFSGVNAQPTTTKPPLPAGK